jgi:hypothetical protein
VADQRVEPTGNLCRGGVGGAEGSGNHAVAGLHPCGSHIAELQRARAGMLKVADQLPEDPGLVRVGHTAVFLLHHRLGEHFALRQVM